VSVLCIACVLDLAPLLIRVRLLSFQEDHPPILVQLQHEHWDPLLAWVKERFGSTIVPITGLLGASQADDAVAPLRRHIDSYDAWELAAFERAVMATKSFVIALRLVEANRTSDGEQWGVEEASQAAEVEVKSQTEKWGMVGECAAQLPHWTHAEHDTARRHARRGPRGPASTAGRLRARPGAR